MAEKQTFAHSNVAAQQLAVGNAVCAVGNDGQPAKRVQLMPFGNPFFVRDGRGPWRLTPGAHAQAVIAATKAYHKGALIAGDYDHQSVLATAPGVGGTSRASAWIDPETLSEEDDGIWADVEWTDAARQALAAKEYRFVSPFFTFDDDGCVTVIRNFGLTNNPALQLAAVAAASNEAPKSMKKIAMALGLSEDAGEDEIVTAIKSMMEKSTAMSAEVKAAAKALGLADDADAGALASAATDLTAKADKADGGVPDMKDYVPRPMYDAAVAQAQKGGEEAAIAAADAAISSGKVPPANREWAIAQAKSDLAGFNAMVGNTPSFTDTPALAAAKPATGTALTSEEAAVASQLGLSEEQMLKSRNAQKGNI